MVFRRDCICFVFISGCWHCVIVYVYDRAWSSSDSFLSHLKNVSEQVNENVCSVLVLTNVHSRMSTLNKIVFFIL